MSLWGNLDNATGNQKPLFANTSNATSKSTINDGVANTDAYYGMVMGISTGEMANVASKPQKPTHSGWVSVKYGTGPITGISVSGGTGINSAGFLIVTDTSAHGQGTGANISYTTANAQNSLQSYSSNAQLNTFGTFTVVNGGSGFSNASALTIVTNGTAIANGTFTATLGGRAGRVKTEVLVAMGSITGDDPRDNVLFTGI
jgi:hypothetical protein